jgi:predicted Zn-dependent peptidase
MAGMFSEEDKKLINQIFGSQAWNQQEKVQLPVYEVQPETEKKHRILHDDKSVQGSIRLARPFPQKTHPDFVPMIMLNTLFGGYFGSRLMSNIREEKGYTYGIHSMMLNQKYDGAFMISTEAGKDVCEAAVQEIYKEMNILKNELVDEEELNLVKNYLLGSILGGLDGSFHIIQRWKGLILNGFTQERFYNNIEIYKSITPAQLQLLAQKYFDESAFYELIVT